MTITAHAPCYGTGMFGTDSQARVRGGTYATITAFTARDGRLSGTTCMSCTRERVEGGYLNVEHELNTPETPWSMPLTSRTDYHDKPRRVPSH